MVDLLSQYTIEKESMKMSKDLRSCRIHNSSEVRVAKALYSASTEDLATMVYFFDFQVMRVDLRKTQKPAIDFLEVVQLPQLASQKACTRREDTAGNRSS